MVTRVTGHLRLDKRYFKELSFIQVVTRVTGHLRLDKRYFKELSFIQVALTGLSLNNG